MATKKKAPKRDRSAEDVIAALRDEQLVNDSRALVAMMRRISGRRPRVWNVGTIGFDTYRSTYDSGREGEGHALGFYPRKGKITVYLMDGTARHAALLARLGKHSATRVCVYLRRLADVQLPILERIARRSYEYLKAHDGKMHRVE